MFHVFFIVDRRPVSGAIVEGFVVVVVVVVLDVVNVVVDVGGGVLAVFISPNIGTFVSKGLDSK